MPKKYSYSSGKPRDLPEGYQHPHEFDPHIDPELGGYRLGTVRDWKKGPHIKLHDGWYPYDRKSQSVQIEDEQGKEKWVHIKTPEVFGEEIGTAFDIAQNLDLPNHKMLDNVRNELTSTYEKLADRSTRDKPEVLELAKGVIPRVNQLMQRQHAFLSSVKEQLSADEVRRMSSSNGALVEEMRGVVTALKDYNTEEGEKKTAARKELIAAAARTCMQDDEVLMKLQGIVNRLAQLKPRPPGPSWRFSIPEGQDSSLVERLGKKPVLMQPLASQGMMNITMLRKLEDGTETVFKDDATSLAPGARNENAAYLFVKNVLGGDSIPASLLVHEAPWDDQTLENAQPRARAAGFELLAKSSRDASHPGVVMERIKGINGEAAKKKGREDLLDPSKTKADPRDWSKRIMDIYALDYISGNWDRKMDNIMFDENKDGLPVGIDSSLCFQVKADRAKINNEFMDLLKKSQTAFPKEMKAACAALGEKLADANTGTFYDTIGHLIPNTRMIMDASGRLDDFREVLRKMQEEVV
jgi:hypothetical protein